MNTEHQPQQPPTPDDWTDTVEPERAEADTNGPVLRDDCCSQTLKDACTDEWVQIAPESARPATLTPEQPVKAHGQGEGSQRPSEPVLPRRIKPEDVRVGMVVERRKGDAAYRDRVHKIDGERIVGINGAWLWIPGHADIGWSLWLVEDAPEPVDPDAELVERMARAIDAEPGFNVSDMAYAALRALREIRDVTPRAEQ